MLIVGVILGYIALTAIHHGARASELNDLQATFAADSAAWLASSLLIADGVFAAVLACSFVVTIVSYLGRNHNIEGVGRELTLQFGFAAIPFLLLQAAHTFLPDLLTFSTGLGTRITGQTISGPGAVMALGVKIAGQIMNVAGAPVRAFDANPPTVLNPTSGWGDLGAGLIGFLPAIVVAVLILVCFAILTGELLLAFAQAYITIAVGACQLGWSGAGGTKAFAEAYWAGVMATIFRLIVIIAMCALIVYAANGWSTKLATLTNPKDALSSWFALLGVVLVVTFVTTKIADLAGNMFSGRPTLSAMMAGQWAESSALKTGSAVRALSRAMRAGGKRA